MVKERYYFHGDVTEFNHTLVYCAKCDSFEPVAHFYESNAHNWSKQSDYDRYERMRKSFARKDCTLHLKYTRPPNAQNIFA